MLKVNLSPFPLTLGAHQVSEGFLMLLRLGYQDARKTQAKKVDRRLEVVCEHSWLEGGLYQGGEISAQLPTHARYK